MRKTNKLQIYLNRTILSCIVTVILFSLSNRANAQTENTYNKDVRTKTWSIYAQGGLSWATGVWYSNIDAKKSYKLAPAVGGGINYNIRPWVRVGAEYIYSRYRREQRIQTIDPTIVPFKVYGNYLMNFHNVKAGIDFNILEIWKNRKAQWLNIYLGTGVGYMMAKGNEYGIYFSTTQTQDGKTIPVSGSINIDNSSSITFTGNVKTTNNHSSFNKLYVPTSLHIEADISRQFSVGLKGEADWLLNREEIAPQNVIFALATVRYNFGVGKKTKIMLENYSNEVKYLNERIKELLNIVDEEKEKADAVSKENKTLCKENEILKRSLKECEESKIVEEKPSHCVQFDNNSSLLSKEENEKLKVFAQSVKGEQLSIIAEASSPGSKNHNQTLSEKRLQSVVEALIKEGFTKENLIPRFAIGSQNQIPTAEGRRVTITVK